MTISKSAAPCKTCMLWPRMAFQPDFCYSVADAEPSKISCHFIPSLCKVLVSVHASPSDRPQLPQAKRGQGWLFSPVNSHHMERRRARRLWGSSTSVSSLSAIGLRGDMRRRMSGRLLGRPNGGRPLLESCCSSFVSSAASISADESTPSEAQI